MKIEFKDYQEWVNLMSELQPDKIETYLGLAGETGEVLDEIKKIERDVELTPKRLDNLYNEMGDLLHYYVRVMNQFDMTLDDIMRNNVTKLEERHGPA